MSSSPLVRDEHPGGHKKRGSKNISQHIPCVSLAMRDKPLVDFIRYSKCSRANDSQTGTCDGWMGLVKGPEQQNAEYAKFKTMCQFITESQKQRGKLSTRIGLRREVENDAAIQEDGKPISNEVPHYGGVMGLIRHQGIVGGLWRIVKSRYL